MTSTKQLEKIVDALEDISININTNPDLKQLESDSHIQYIPKNPQLKSDSDISPIDLKTIELLDLIEQYEKLVNDQYRLNYINGFLNLSRANYNYTSRRFGSNSFDYRPYDACKEITINDNTGEINLINKLAIHQSKLSQQKKNKHEKKENDDEYEIIDVISEKGISSSSSSTKDSISISTRSLKNRKENLSEKLSSTITVEEDPLPSNSRLQDPINQFGGLVPYQLRQSQGYFNKALTDSVDIINLRSRINGLINEIEKLKT
ncbi:uncharacterized protein RJT21DRAFT_122182 [Scheffersomyces amazonensis]|uniref:uncharacterized protein n=1 Tax=Scheffersomyces amazonensis TaxID=1078765 RepID=UPI00315CF79A